MKKLIGKIFLYFIKDYIDERIINDINQKVSENFHKSLRSYLGEESIIELFKVNRKDIIESSEKALEKYLSTKSVSFGIDVEIQRGFSKIVVMGRDKGGKEFVDIHDVELRSLHEITKISQHIKNLYGCEDMARFIDSPYGSIRRNIY